jgi:hypothetical protein
LFKDEQIAHEAHSSGGSTALVALFIMGKLFVANAGDCRAVLVTKNGVTQLSNDMTPTYERKRLQHLAYQQHDLIAQSFTRYEYCKYLTSKDLNKRILYRDWFMDGWAAKIVKENDLKLPFITPRAKKSRLLGTISLSRSLGDHLLRTSDGKIAIKPFLSATPEVGYRVKSLE